MMIANKIKELNLALDESGGERLNELVTAMSLREVQELEREADRLASRLAFLSGYLLQRGAAGCGDNGHKDALTEGQKTQQKVRKALGFTNP